MGNKRATKRAKKKANRLDYTLVPEPEFTPTFMILPEEFEVAMQKFPRTVGRMKAAIMACREMNSTKPEGGRLKAESGFRAALTEYVAIEDTINRELLPEQRMFKLLDTENPLPHILRLLRHLQVHRGGSELSDTTISLWLKYVPGAQPVDVIRWLISDLNDSQLLDLDAFKDGYYTSAQATEMVNWINTRQNQFGIHDIIYRGVVEAAERIVAHYC